MPEVQATAKAPVMKPLMINVNMLLLGFGAGFIVATMLQSKKAHRDS